MGHPQQAEKFLRDPERAGWHDSTLWQVRTKRDAAARTVPEWEELREQASRIKLHTLSRLDHYLLEFEQNALANGMVIHWAENADSLNRTVHKILKEKKVRNVVKSKSMLTEECRLNDYLAGRGITVTDTDLGEWIVQLSREKPSHIVMPAIHKKMEEIDHLFRDHLKTEPARGDATYLTRSARAALREKFLSADAAITGVNFAVAETGEFVVCTNEGNADMGVHHAPLHIAAMGIEKIIPRYQDLGTFLRLLARSATGQSITSYTSHFRAPEEGRELHIILVDNGRTRQLGREKFHSSLACIRCGACMNTCPVYRRSGGHSYDSVIPGPIGAILSPGMDMSKHASLPFASTLCGSCTDVCPVKINIHEQLYEWRQIITREAESSSRLKEKGASTAAGVLQKPRVFQLSGRLIRGLMRRVPGFRALARRNAWGRSRDLPEAPARSFQEWYRTNRKSP